MPLDDPTLAWLADRHQAVLVTLRADGSPQTSHVMYDVAGGLARVSVTDDRAKTRNLRRDPRGVLHVPDASFWAFASVRVSAELSPVSTSPGDVVGQELLAVYRGVSGQDHPDPEEFYAAMIADRRLVLRLTPLDAVTHGVTPAPR